MSESGAWRGQARLLPTGRGNPAWAAAHPTATQAISGSIKLSIDVH